MCSVKVHDWLVLLTMEKYWHVFIERGYVSITHCQQIICSDLIMLGINNPQHRQLLLDGVQLMINSPNLFICREPCELHAVNPQQSIKAFKFKGVSMSGSDKVIPSFSPVSSEGDPDFLKQFTNHCTPCEPKSMQKKKEETQKDKAVRKYNV